MEDAQHEDRPTDETAANRPDDATTSPQAAAGQVARLLANPRRTRRA